MTDADIAFEHDRQEEPVSNGLILEAFRPIAEQLKALVKIRNKAVSDLAFAEEQMNGYRVALEGLLGVIPVTSITSPSTIKFKPSDQEAAKELTDLASQL